MFRNLYKMALVDGVQPQTESFASLRDLKSAPVFGRSDMAELTTDGKRGMNGWLQKEHYQTCTRFDGTCSIVLELGTGIWVDTIPMLLSLNDIK